MNKFTLIIHNKGWTVTKACEYWGIHYDTYNKRCNNPKMHNQLESMCQGLKQRTIVSSDIFLEQRYDALERQNGAWGNTL